MTKNRPAILSEETRKAWWKIHQDGEFQLEFEIDQSMKPGFLSTIYSGLYSELRDIHSRQQQVVAWGFTLLAGGGFLTLIITNSISLLQSVIFSAILGMLTYILTRTLGFLSEDRMSIARQLDRIHQIMGVFTKDQYVQGTTLFDPVWYGWGFDKERDVNWRLSQTYKTVLWVVLIIDVILIFIKV